MEKGLFRIKETVIAHSDGHTTISRTPKITGFGQSFFINYFLNKENNSLNNEQVKGVAQWVMN
jgi:anti-repressor protein